MHYWGEKIKKRCQNGAEMSAEIDQKVIRNEFHDKTQKLQKPFQNVSEKRFIF